MSDSIVVKATIDDIDDILLIICDAKEFLRQQGSVQWQDSDGYPNRSTFETDIEKDQLYVIKVNNRACAVCAITTEFDESYKVVHDGQWEIGVDVPYMSIHRIAVKKEYMGQKLAYRLVEYAKELAKERSFKSVKADTMVGNKSMRGLLEKCGFNNRGIIYLVSRGALDPKRLAYEYVIN